jgi:hypothetical protein
MTDSSPTSDPRGDYRVVVFATPDDPQELGKLLADRLHLHPTDAQVHAHAVPGVLPDHLSQADAGKLAAAITGFGVNAASIADADIPHFEHAEVLHHVRCLDNGLEVIELHGEPEFLLAWDEIQLISIGYVPLEEQRRFRVDRTLIHSAPQPADGTTDVPSLSGPEAWIIRRNPERGFRIAHGEMNYEYLGDRKTGSATHNFRLFMDDLIARVPHAYITPAARAYIGRGLLRDYEFASLELHRSYTVFHLLLLHRMQAAQ